MQRPPFVAQTVLLASLAVSAAAPTSAAHAPGPELASLGRRQAATHRFSTLFTAQDVRRSLSTEEGLNQAIDWCNRTAVTKVYVESFRDGYQADRAVLETARDRLRRAGLEVSGCITPTSVGKKSNRWNTIACYTDLPTQEKLQASFEYAASMFDEIMIDDFWFTDCSCAECDAARASRQVTVGGKTTSIAGDTWEDYRRELMVRMSRERVLAPAKKVNPKVRLIIKYPQWYDTFHERGYDVDLQTKDFDRTWVGTETRDYGDSRWGGTVQYEAYFIMRWLGGLGGKKCGGGWYDWLGTTEKTYIEQARQTVLGGARESMLFCYGGLQRDTGPRNVEVLRTHIPELLQVAGQVGKRDVIGIAAYKPANSHPENERRVYDFVGMLGLPLAPCHEFPAGAKAAFFPIHAVKDPNLVQKLDAFIGKGRPVLLTDGLARQLRGKLNLDRSGVRVLKVGDDPKSLLNLEQAEIDDLRKPLLAPFRTAFSAPNQVALYLFKDGSWVVENFNDQPVSVRLNGQTLAVDARGWLHHWR